MNLLYATNIQLIIELVISFIVLLIVYEISGYVTCKLIRFRCSSVLYNVVGFICNIAIYAFVFTILSGFTDISYKAVGYVYICSMIIYLLISLIILQNKKKLAIRELFIDKEQRIFIILIVFIQIVVMYLTLAQSSLDSSSVIVNKVNNIVSCNNKIGNIVAGIGLDTDRAKIFVYDSYLASLSNIINGHLWIIYNPVMAMLKIVFYTCITYATGELIYKESKKINIFTIVCILIGLLFYTGGTEASAIYRGVVGENLYNLSSGPDTIIRIVMIPMLVYLLIKNYQDDDAEGLICLVSVAMSVTKYTGAFIAIIMLTAYRFVKVISKKGKLIANIKVWLMQVCVPAIMLIILCKRLKITYFLYFKDLYKELWSYNKIVIVITMGIMVYGLIKDKSDIRNSVVLPTMLIMICLMNPIVTKFTGKFLGFADLQNKVWWCIPYTLIIAYGLIEIYESYKEKVVLYLALSIVLVLYLFNDKGWKTGYANMTIKNSIDSITNVNIFMFDNDSKDIVNLIRNASETNIEVINVFAGYGMSHTINLYDSNINVYNIDNSYNLKETYSRDNAYIMYEKGELSLLELVSTYDTDYRFMDIRQELINNKVDYAVVEDLSDYATETNRINTDGYYEDDTVSEIGRIAGYSIVSINQ